MFWVRLAFLGFCLSPWACLPADAHSTPWDDAVEDFSRRERDFASDSMTIDERDKRIRTATMECIRAQAAADRLGFRKHYSVEKPDVSDDMSRAVLEAKLVGELLRHFFAVDASVKEKPKLAYAFRGYGGCLIESVEMILRSIGARAVDQFIEADMIAKITALFRDAATERGALFKICDHPSVRDQKLMEKTWYAKLQEDVRAGKFSPQIGRDTSIDETKFMGFYNGRGFHLVAILEMAATAPDATKARDSFEREKTLLALFRYATLPTPANGIGSLTTKAMETIAAIFDRYPKLFDGIDDKDPELGRSPRDFFLANIPDDNREIPFDRYMGKGTLGPAISRIRKALAKK